MPEQSLENSTVSGSGRSNPDVAPNILFITLDQFRAECLSCAGHLVQTPNLDRLAARGVRFSRHYAQAAPCGPSRASLLTGMYMHNHRSVGNGTPLSSRFTNLALELNKIGYESLLFGYTDTSADPRELDPEDPRLKSYEGFLPGFEVVQPLTNDRVAFYQWLTRLGYSNSDITDYAQLTNQYLFNLSHESLSRPAFFAAEHSESAFITDRTIAECEQRLSLGEQPPRLIHLTYIRPHPPFVVPAPFHKIYDPADMPTPQRHPTPELEALTHPVLAMALQFGLGSPADETTQRQLQATYFSMITEVDLQVGRLLDWLRDSGLESNTVVILTSDHGEMLGDHWMLSKNLFFDQAFAVPLIIAGPGIAEGSLVDSFTESVDIFPTICELARVSIPQQCDGVSLVPFLKASPPQQWRDEAHYQWDFRMIGHSLGMRPESCWLNVIQDNHTKYVHFAGAEPVLFDLDADPAQLTNIASDPLARDRLATYQAKTLNFFMNNTYDALANKSLTALGVVELT